MRVYAEVSSNQSEIEYYVSVGKKYIKCWDLPRKYDISEDSIDKVISKISNLLKKHQSSSKNRWSVYTLEFDSNLKFKEYYDYDDLTDGNYEFKKKKNGKNNIYQHRV